MPEIGKQSAWGDPESLDDPRQRVIARPTRPLAVENSHFWAVLIFSHLLRGIEQESSVLTRFHTLLVLNVLYEIKGYGW